GRWYKTAETKLTGLDKAKVGKRLAEIAEIAAAVQPGLAVTRPGQLPRGEWTEVLPWVDIRRDTADGAWFRQGPLVVGRWGQGRLMLPVRIDGEYDLRVEFRPSRDPNGGLIGLPVGKTNCMLSVGTVPAQGGRIGLSNVDGKPALDNVTTVRGFKLAKNQSYLVDIQVRVKGDGATIRVVVNGKLAMNWSGKQSSLTMPAEWAVPEIDRPAIGVYRMIAAFRRAAVRPVSGTAVRIGADAGGERGE
ncbi:MAG: hypothetical protein HQ581_20995, partial [Planctomycetes bacterium]|nr:hypothetical protein [Planctomycetota bacterium]